MHNDDAFYRHTKARLAADKKHLAAAINTTTRCLALVQWFEAKRGASHPKTLLAKRELVLAQRGQAEIEARVEVNQKYVTQREKEFPESAE